MLSTRIDPYTDNRLVLAIPKYVKGRTFLFKNAHNLF